MKPVNPFLKLVAVVVFSMLNEILLRRNDVTDKADFAEATAVAAVVAVGMEHADKIPLPVYVKPFKAALINEANLTLLTKYLLDLAEGQVNTLMNQVWANKLEK